MNKYTVSIKEVLERLLIVDATNEAEAISKVKEMYKNEEVVLDYSDFVDTSIDIYKEEGEQ